MPSAMTVMSSADTLGLLLKKVSDSSTESLAGGK